MCSTSGANGEAAALLYGRPRRGRLSEAVPNPGETSPQSRKERENITLAGTNRGRGERIYP
eukprot:143103-Prorocentrum_minimum.AAC.2